MRRRGWEVKSERVRVREEVAVEERVVRSWVGGVVTVGVGCGVMDTGRVSR